MTWILNSGSGLWADDFSFALTWPSELFRLEVSRTNQSCVPTGHVWALSIENQSILCSNRSSLPEGRRGEDVKVTEEHSVCGADAGQLHPQPVPHAVSSHTLQKPWALRQEAGLGLPAFCFSRLCFLVAVFLLLCFLVLAHLVFVLFLLVLLLFFMRCQGQGWLSW